MKKRIFETKKELMLKDSQDLENFTKKQYQEAVKNIPLQKDKIREHSQKLITALDKQGKALHTEINTVIQRMKSEIEDMGALLIGATHQHEKAINYTITEMEKVIIDLKKLKDSQDAWLVSEYTSRTAEFRNSLAQFQETLPTFTPREINREQIHRQIGLSKLDITYTFLDEPRILTDIQTKCGALRNVSCLNDNELWTRGDRDNIMSLYNLEGELLRSIQTKGGHSPRDIAVTQSKELVYTDIENTSINLISSTNIRTLITPLGWSPFYLCSELSGDLPVIMESDDKKQTKVVRYSDSIETQSIQWDDQGKPLYTSGGYIKCLSENRNLDMCVADWDARAVVVVSAAGNLRFRYTGPHSTTLKSFYPLGITTDSWCNIMISDCGNHSIHIISTGGHFLRYIKNCSLQRDLCVDSGDHLFVAEFYTGKVKKIKYYK